MHVDVLVIVFTHKRAKISKKSKELVTALKETLHARKCKIVNINIIVLN